MRLYNHVGEVLMQWIKVPTVLPKHRRPQSHESMDLQEEYVADRNSLFKKFYLFSADGKYFIDVFFSSLRLNKREYLSTDVSSEILFAMDLQDASSLA